MVVHCLFWFSFTISIVSWSHDELNLISVMFPAKTYGWFMYNKELNLLPSKMSLHKFNLLMSSVLSNYQKHMNYYDFSGTIIPAKETKKNEKKNKFFFLCVIWNLDDGRQKRCAFFRVQKPLVSINFLLLMERKLQFNSFIFMVIPSSMAGFFFLLLFVNFSLCALVSTL